VQLAWKILVGLSVVFGVVTGVATVAHWDWAYPVPLLIALALLAVGLGVALLLTRRDHAAEMKQARQDHTTELAEAGQDHATELAEVRQQHATELADARDHRADELTEAQRARDAALAEAERDRAALAEAKVYADRQARAHDERLFAETRLAVPRKAVRWLHDERHPYLRDFIVRLARAGVTDERRLLAH
jgi:C4-dicarboxylate-specific signal transduction histidine kinase